MAKIPQFTEQVDTQQGGGLLPQGLVRVQEGGVETGFGQGLVALGLLVSKAQTARVDKKILDNRSEARAFFSEAISEAEKDTSGSAVFNFKNTSEAYIESMLEGLTGRAEDDARRFLNAEQADALLSITRTESTRSATAYKASLGVAESEMIKNGSAFLASSSSEAEITSFEETLEAQIAEHKNAYLAGAANGSYLSLEQASLAFDTSNQLIRTNLYTQLLSQGTPAAIGIVERALADEGIRSALGTSIPGLQDGLNTARASLSTLNLGALRRQANIISTSGGGISIGTDDGSIELGIEALAERADSLVDLTFKGGLTPEQLFTESNTLIETFFETNGRTIIENGLLPKVLEGMTSRSELSGLDIDYEGIATKALERVSGQNKVAINSLGETLNDRASLQTVTTAIPITINKSVTASVNAPAITSQEINDVVLSALSMGNTGKAESGLFVPDSPEDIVMSVLQPTINFVQANLGDPRNRETARAVLDTASSVLGVPIENKIISDLKSKLTEAEKGGTLLNEAAGQIYADMQNNIAPDGIITPGMNSALSTLLRNNLDIPAAIKFARSGTPTDFMTQVVKESVDRREYAAVFDILNRISDDGGSSMSVLDITGTSTKDYPETALEIIGNLALTTDDVTQEAIIGFFEGDPQAMGSMVERNKELRKILLNDFSASDKSILFASSEGIRKILSDVLNGGNGTDDPFHPDIVKRHAPMFAFFVTKEMRENQSVFQTGLNEENILGVYKNAAANFGEFVRLSQVATVSGLMPKRVLKLLQPFQQQGVVDDLVPETVEAGVDLVYLGGFMGRGHEQPGRLTRTVVTDTGAINTTIRNAERQLQSSGITARPHFAFAVDGSLTEGEGEILVIPMRDQENQTQGYLAFRFQNGRPEPLLNGASLPGLISVAAANTLGSRSIKPADVVNSEFVRFMELERQFGDISKQMSRENLPFYVSSTKVAAIEQAYIDSGGDIDDVDALLEFTEQMLGNE